MSNLFNYIYELKGNNPTHNMESYCNNLCGNAYGRYGIKNIYYAYDNRHQLLIKCSDLKYILSSKNCYIFINLRHNEFLIRLTNYYQWGAKETSIKWINSDLSFISIKNSYFGNLITNYYFRDGVWKLTLGEKKYFTKKVEKIYSRKIFFCVNQYRYIKNK